MSEKSHSRSTVNKVAIAGSVVALGLIIASNKSAEHTRHDSSTHEPDTTYAVTKDCITNPHAYQKFTLGDLQHILVSAGLTKGHLKNEDVVEISGTAHELTIKPYGDEGRTVFPDKLTNNLVEEFPFPVLGTVAIGRMNGSTDPSVFLACDINALTAPGQPLDGQIVAQMSPMQ